MDNINLLKTQSEVEHEDNNGRHSENEYDGSAVRGMDEEDEQDHDDFPFEHSYLRPTYVEDIHVAPEDLLLASQEEDHGMDQEGCFLGQDNLLSQCLSMLDFHPGV